MLLQPGHLVSFGQQKIVRQDKMYSIVKPRNLDI